jgi:hypothetical protein
MTAERQGNNEVDDANWVSARVRGEQMRDMGEFRGSRGPHLGTRATWAGKSWGSGHSLMQVEHTPWARARRLRGRGRT